MSRERTYLDEQRQELIRLRAELERRPAAAEAAASDTQLDGPAPDRLASARRLLRLLAERRKTLAQASGCDRALGW